MVVRRRTWGEARFFAAMTAFNLDDISDSPTSQPDSPWLRFNVACGDGPAGHALVNQTQSDGLDASELRRRVLDRLNQMASAQGYPVVVAQLRTSGIRVHLNS
jgi:hypothetical protein